MSLYGLSKAVWLAVPVAEEEFWLHSGELKVYIKVSDSGTERQQTFCTTCGTPIYATSNDVGLRHLGIRVGALEDRENFIPQRQFWTKSAVYWLGSIKKITQFERQ